MMPKKAINRSGSVDTVNLTGQICVDRKNHLYNWRHLGKDLDRIHLTTVLYARVKWKKELSFKTKPYFHHKKIHPSQDHKYIRIH